MEHSVGIRPKFGGIVLGSVVGGVFLPVIESNDTSRDSTPFNRICWIK